MTDARGRKRQTSKLVTNLTITPDIGPDLYAYLCACPDRPKAITSLMIRGWVSMTNAQNPATIALTATGIRRFMPAAAEEPEPGGEDDGES